MRRRRWRRSFRRRCLRSSSDEDTARRSHRVELRGARRQEDRRDIGGHVELAGSMPSGAVEQQHRMSARGDVARDFIEVKLHHVGISVGQRQRRSHASRRADRAEQIGVVVALVSGLYGPRSTPGPLADEAVLLADSASSWNQISTGLSRNSPEMSFQRAREVFLNASTIRSS